jgi:hypothetical protein
VLFFLLCVATSALFAQAASGSMSGTLMDANGAVIPGGKIVATHVPTGRDFPAQTTEAGIYVFPNLPPGPYTVTVEHPGFKKLVRTGIEIRIGQRQDLDLKLEVGDVQQKIEVTAAAPLLETSQAERGQVISNQVLYSLPVYSGGLRLANAFVNYMPGVNNNGETSINGSNGRAKDILIDGASITIPESGGTNFYFPGFEAYQEMKLITSTFNAEYGRLGGGLEMYTSKSGTNDVHASAFWDLRRDIFEAAGWAQNQVAGRTAGYRAKVRYNEEGGTAGGPVWLPKIYDGRNKTFFYFTYAKDIRPASPVVTTGLTVPTKLMKQGVFSEIPALIYDPTTTGSDGNRTPFANNTIPTSRWSKISTNIVNSGQIPDPTGAGYASNYTLNGASTHDDTIWTLKLDHAFNNAHRVAFFMTRRSYFDDAPSNFSTALSNGLVNGQYPEDYRGNYDWMISPTKLLHITFGNSQTIQLWNNPYQNGWGSKFGFTGLTAQADATPYISFATDSFTYWGMNQGKVNNGGQFNYTYQYAGQFTWVKGKHEYKFGVDVRRLQTTGDDWATTNGSYSFSRFQTAQNAATTSTTGNSFASFLLGATASAYRLQLPVVIGQTRYGYHSGFAQDNWRVNSRLTVNYGVRYEIPIGWHSRDGLYSNVDLNKPNPGADNLPGALVYAGTGPGRSGVKRFYPTDYTNIGPRGGFAYRVSDKTTLRGGFGLFYQTLGNGGCGCTSGIGGTSLSASSSDIGPATYWDNGIPSTSTGTSTRFSPTALNYDDAGNLMYQGSNYGKAPRIYNWSFTIQHEFKNFLFEAAYVGNRGRGLNSSTYLNQLPYSYLSLGTLLGKQITDPLVVAAGYKAPFTNFSSGWKTGATLAQALRPYPQFGILREVNSGQGRTWYDALQTKVERRFGGLQLMASYVYSKSLSMMTYRQIFSQGSNVQTQDAQNPGDSKGLMYMDVPHFLNILTSYRMPIGKGQRFLTNANRWVNAAIGGWTISSTQQYRSGTLLQIYTQGNPLGSGVLFAPVTKANYSGNAIRTSQGATDMDPNNPNSRWFNYGTSAPFTAAPTYTYGTTAMYNPQVRNPWFRNENVSIGKDFKFAERFTLKYRADFMNIFNRSDLGSINVTVGNANFGRPTGAMQGQRYISMGARVEF